MAAFFQNRFRSLKGPLLHGILCDDDAPQHDGEIKDEGDEEMPARSLEVLSPKTHMHVLNVVLVLLSGERQCDILNILT